MKNSLIPTLILTFSLAMIQPGQAQKKKSAKRGVSYDIPYLKDLEVLSEGVTWFYNWGVAPISSLRDAADTYLDYVPMVWNNGYDRTKLRTYLTNHPKVKYILGFNEPNFKAQANMTPSQAAAAWPELEAIADEFNLKIVAPAVNYGPTNGSVTEGNVTYTNPWEYLDAFFAAAPNARVDYIAVHCYMNDPNAMDWFVKEFINKYHKPIWLTEFCAWESNAPLNAGRAEGLPYQRSTMIRKIEVLEKNPMVEKYAWFIPRTNNEIGYPYMQLMRSVQTDPMYDIVGSGVLTDLGNVYLNMSTFDSTYFAGVNQQIPAKDYIESFWVKLETTTDTACQIPIQLCDFQSGLYTDYFIDVPTAGNYQIQLRIANLANVNPKFKISSNGTQLTSQEVPSTGGVDKWATRILPITLLAGKQTLRITSSGSSGCKMVWFSLMDQTELIQTPSTYYEAFVDNNKKLQFITNETINATLYDCSGRQLIKGISTKGTDLSALSNGMYILEIKYENGKQTTTKILINQ